MTLLLFFAFLYLWLAFVGGTVGSFLNVVVYRVPAGLSVVHPPSRCPVCEHPIRWYDNIPVLGWLWLRGQCRDCGVSISPRYPVVEALTAAAFLLIALADGLDRVWYESLVAVRSEVTTSEFLFVCCRFLTHIVMLCALWTAALMQYDRQIPPRGMTIIVAATLWLAASAMNIYWPDTNFFGFTQVPPIGLLVGSVLVAVFCMVSTYFWTWRVEEVEQNRWTFAEFGAIAALVVEPGLMVWVVATAVFFGLAAAFVSRRANYPLLCLTAALLVHMAAPWFDFLLPDHSDGLGLYIAVAAFLNSWYPLTFCALIVLMTEACVIIRRVTAAVPPDADPADGEEADLAGP